jgi:cyclase
MKKLLFLAALVTLIGGAKADSLPAVHVQKINDHAYALLGPMPADVPNRVNGGYVHNSLAIIGDKGVILVDTGSHRQVGEHLKEAIAKLTPKPVTHVLITHFHSDHSLGTIAFPDAKVISSADCAKQIENSGLGMVGFMGRMTGLSLTDTRAVVPGETIPPNSRQEKEINSIRLVLITPKASHTDGDMMVWLPEDRILATGDIVVNAVTPNFSDGNLKQWITVLDDTLKLTVQTYMPGHGPLMQHQDVEGFRALLAGFYSVVEQTYKSGGAESDVRKNLDLSQWQKLSRYDQLMGSNINRVWLQVEADNF